MALLPFITMIPRFCSKLRGREVRWTKREERYSGHSYISRRKFSCFVALVASKKTERKNYLDRIVDIHSYKYRLNARDPRIEFMQGKGEGGGHNERVPGAYYSCYLAVNQS